MSWADCFEENSTGIDYKAFARYAADVIVKMGDAKELERRAEVVARVKNMGESKVLGNLTSESLETYLEGCFVEIEDSRGNVDEKGFHAVLQSIPSVNLSDREASSVGAVVARSLDGTIQWREFIPWAFSTVYEVCRERMIGRRMALLKVVTDPDDRSQLSVKYSGSGNSEESGSTIVPPIHNVPQTSFTCTSNVIADVCSIIVLVLNHPMDFQQPIPCDRDLSLIVTLLGTPVDPD
eukprot:gene41726-55343_t